MLKYNEWLLVTESYVLKTESDIESNPDVNTFYQAIKQYVTDNGLNIEMPITMNKNGDVKVVRTLSNQKFNQYIKSLFRFEISNSSKRANIGKGFKVSFGNGTRSKTGMSRGLEFENVLQSDIIKWVEEGDDAFSKMNDPNITKDVIDKLNLTSTAIKVEDVKISGGENNKRSLMFNGKQPYIGSLNVAETGRTLADLTITTNPEFFVSCKVGRTVTFFNAGVKGILPIPAIKTGNYSNEALLLFEMLGIKPEKFTQVFGYLENGVEFSEKETINNLNADMLSTFIKTGIGAGYWLVHKDYRARQNQVKYIDATFLDKASKIMGPITVHYGGKTKHGIRVDIEFNTEIYNFKINIRDKQGKDGYPSHIMMDYTYL